jgi:hypothetical protein
MTIPPDLELRVAKLSLRPGDILVAKSTVARPKDALRLAQEALAAYVPVGAKVLVIGPDIDIATIRLEEIERVTGGTAVIQPAEG